MNGHMKPADIEKRSFAIITEELGGRTFPESVAEVVKRVIHTSADFDYADNLCCSPDAVEQAKAALEAGRGGCARGQGARRDPRDRVRGARGEA